MARKPKAPISTHRLFPAIVAVWLAALFGLGCAVLPGGMIERFVSGTGIAAIVPAAAPPLGVTARILISLAAAITGAAAGYAIARRIGAMPARARPAKAETLETHGWPVPSADGKRRLTTAKDDLADAEPFPPVNETEPMPGRRRALAIAEEEQAGGLAEEATLPGGEPEWLQAQTEFSGGPSPDFEYEAESFEDEDAPDEPENLPEQEEHEAPLVLEPPFLVSEGASEEQPLVFSAPSQMARPAPEREPSPEPEPEAAAVPVPASESELDGLGMAQLAERLARAMQNRAGRPRTPPPPFAAQLKRDYGPEETGAEASAEETPAFEATAAETPEFEVPEFEAAPPAYPTVMPELAAELEELGEEEFEDLEFDDEYAEEDDFDEYGEEEGEDEDGGGYSSLLAMKSPLRTPSEFVRIDEPEPEEGAIEPAVVLPGESAGAARADESGAAGPEAAEPDEAGTESPERRPFDAPEEAGSEKPKQDPEETDRALRDALAKLQRMSGAA